MSQQYTSHSSFDKTLNTSQDKAFAVAKGHRNEWQVTPSNTTPVWGSQFTISYRTKNVHLDELVLQFSMPAISGLTVSNSGTSAYISSFFWFSKIDIYVGSQIIDTLFPLQNFINHNFFAPNDEKRSLMNVASGTWNSHTVRATKSASAGYWYIPLYTCFNQGSIPLLQGSPDLELRVTMNALADSYSITSGETASGTVAGTIVSCNLLTRASYMPKQSIDYHSGLMRRSALHFPFTEVRQQQITLASGSTSYSTVLSGITGYVPFLFIVLRASSPTGSNVYTFNTTLSSFEIFSGSSENIIGGQAITDLQDRLVYAGRWTDTTFLSDTGAGVYYYSWGLDPQATFNRCINTGGYVFRGSEQLKLTFSSAPSAAVQVDVLAVTYSALEITANMVKKISLMP